MQRPRWTATLLLTALALTGCVQERGEQPASGSPEPAAKPASPGQDAGGSESDRDWVAGDTIDSGRPGVPAIRILAVHKNGSGPRAGTGKTATLRYKAMKITGEVMDPGRRPFRFRVGSGRAIPGWDVIVAKMRIGDSFTATVPEKLAYPGQGELKFDMELLKVE